MPTYQFKCPECGHHASAKWSIAEYSEVTTVPCKCGEANMNRVYTPLLFTMPMADGYNPTVGRYVSGPRDFREQLKIASEQATERTGIPHNFVPVDNRDHEVFGITEEGLAEDNKTRHDRGEATVSVPGLDV